MATRLDAIGTIFGAWTAERVRPWLLAIVALFGPDRCMRATAEQWYGTG